MNFELKDISSDWAKNKKKMMKQKFAKIVQESTPILVPWLAGPSNSEGLFSAAVTCAILWPPCSSVALFLRASCWLSDKAAFSSANWQFGSSGSAQLLKAAAFAFLWSAARCSSFSASVKLSSLLILSISARSTPLAEKKLTRDVRL